MATQVFIVEDDELISRLMVEMLTKKGYLIAGVAEDGETALKLIPETISDVVLMDVSLRGKIDGISVAKILASKVHVPVIYVTANFDDELIERAKMANTFGYILKPFTMKDLVSHIEIALFNFKLRGGPGQVPVNGPAEESQNRNEAAHRESRKKAVKKKLEDLYTYGFHHQAKGDYDTALQCFIGILEQNPEDVHIWAEKGDILFKMGKTEEALASVDHALRLDGTNEYAICKKCRILCSTGRHQDALVLIEKTLRHIPDTYRTLVEKGVVLFELGRTEEAFRVLDEAISMDEKSGYALGAKGRILGKVGREREALATFGRALGREPKNISLWMDLMRIFEERKNHHMVLNILQRAIEKNPTNEMLISKREKLLHTTIPVS